MTTSRANRHSKDTDITPDLVIQPTPTYGVISECKWGVLRNPELAAKTTNKTIEQLETYDDDLTGWPLAMGTEGSMAPHDLVLLVNHEDSKRLAKSLIARRTAGTFKVLRNFAIIGLGQIQRAEGIWPELELEEGQLADPAKTEKLSNRVPINPAKLSLNPQVALVELCDTAPPTPVMMELIHKAAIQNLSRDEHEQNRLDGEVNQPAALDDIMGWLKRFAFQQIDSRDRPCPAPDWILDSMTAFVALHWAERPDPKKDEWIFIHKRGRRLPYATFVKFCAKRDFNNENKDKKREAREVEKQKNKALQAEAKEKKRHKREEARKDKRLQREIASAPLFADQIREESVKKPKKPAT